MNYSLYRNNKEYTLICEDGSVYTFDEHENIVQLDGELNFAGEYPHLGEKIEISDINNKLVQEYATTLVEFNTL